MMSNVRYVLLCALKDRLFYGLILLVLAIALLSSMLGSTAFVENQEMAVVFAAGASRLLLVMTAVVFVCFFIQSSFEHKHMDVILSRPISRDQVVFSHWLGFSLLSLIMIVPVALCLYAIGPKHDPGLAVWGMSMLGELLIMVAFALFASLILSSAVTSVLACLAFYVSSRMMILFLMTAERTVISFFPDAGKLLEKLALFLPRLDLFAHSEWLVYGMQEKYSVALLFSQTALFTALLLALCMIDFRKKEF